MINVSEHILPNGLRVLLVQRPGLHHLLLSTYFQGGAVDEPDEQSGLTHVLEHMLFKGTKHFPSPKVIQQAVEAIGGSFNARTFREGMEVYVSCHPSMLRQGVRILTDVVHRPLFRPDDLARERRVVIEELRSRNDDHGTAFSEFAMATLFPGLAEGRSVGGSVDIVAKLTTKDVRRRYDEVCRSNQQIFVVAGAFEIDEALTEIRRATEDVTLRRDRPRPRRTLTMGPTFGALERPTVQQATVEWSFRTFTEVDTRWPQLWILAHILGTRLFHRVREKHALVYGIGASQWSLRNQGILEIGCRLDPQNLPALVKDVAAEIHAIRTQPVRDIELRNAVKLSFFDLDYDKDKPASLADWFAWQRLGDAKRVFRTPEIGHAIIAGTTTKDLQRLAREILRPAEASCVTMAASPIDARALSRALVREVRRAR